jgi:hypothetical protein
MQKKGEDTKPMIAKQSISGTVIHNGKPVNVGWIGLLMLPSGRHQTAINVDLLRGRTSVGNPFVVASAPINNGQYTIDVPHQHDNWYLALKEPGQAVTQVGPIKIESNEKKQLNIECPEAGSISGKVKNIPKEWKGLLWIVAFTKTAIQYETRVDSDGKFCFRQLQPGEYGLKVGHDAFQDSEVYRGDDEKEYMEAFKRKVDPWKRATIVKVEADRESSGVELELPPE